MFVLFQDATNGAEYTSRRYLEATLSSADRVLLDFDYAYSLYCSECYRWPLLSAENALATHIYAGEKL